MFNPLSLVPKTKARQGWGGGVIEVIKSQGRRRYLDVPCFLGITLLPRFVAGQHTEESLFLGARPSTQNKENAIVKKRSCKISLVFG